MTKTLTLVAAVASVLLVGAGCSIFGQPGTSSTDGGVFQSGDYGTSWQSISLVGVANNREVTIKNENTSQLAFHPTDPQTLYLVTTAGDLYRTINAGGQWRKINQKALALSHVAIDPATPETIYVSQKGNVLKSLDSGSNWETVYIESRTDQQVNGLLIDPNDVATIFAATNTGSLIVSTDSGKTWARRSTLDAVIKKIVLNPTDSQTIFALTEGKGVWRSADSGTNWENLTAALKKLGRKAMQMNDLALKQTDPQTILLGTAYGLFMTTDGGQLWETVPTTLAENTLPIQSVALDPEGKPIMYFSVDNKIHRSTDNGSHWSIAQISTSRRVTSLLIDRTNSAVIYAGVTPVPKK